MSAISEKLGARLRALRADHGWTQVEVGTRAGIAQHTLSRIEKGQMSPSLEVLEKLAAAFGVTEASLLDFGGTGGPGEDPLGRIMHGLPQDGPALRARILKALQALTSGT